VTGTEWLLVGIAVAVAIIGIVGAWRLLKDGETRSGPQRA